jgi:nucleotide-binding universal stress UspA family protein
LSVGEFGAGLVIKDILVPLSGVQSDGRSLDAALIVAAKFSAQVECLRVHPSPMQIIARAAIHQFLTADNTPDLIGSLENAAAKQTQDARALYEQFRRRPDSRGLSWRQIEGDCVPSVIREARYHDLTICARAPTGGDFPIDAVANIVVGCGRPVLLVPDHPLETIGATVAIAWKETAEAAHAVSAAMPFIAGADRVVVLTVVEGDSTETQCSESAERIARNLRGHGLKTEALSVLLGGRPPWRALCQTARESGADLTVMGAYGRSRIRELVFGGFTRDALQDCDLPILLMH